MQQGLKADSHLSTMKAHAPQARAILCILFILVQKTYCGQLVLRSETSQSSKAAPNTSSWFHRVIHKSKFLYNLNRSFDKLRMTKQRLPWSKSSRVSDIRNGSGKSPRIRLQLVGYDPVISSVVEKSIRKAPRSGSTLTMPTGHGFACGIKLRELCNAIL